MIRKLARLIVPVMLLTMILSAPLGANAAGVTITNVNSTVTTTTVNTSATWFPIATGGSGAYEYRYVLRLNSSTGTAVDVTGWTAAASYTYVFSQTGTYYLTVIARDANATSVISTQFAANPVSVIGSGPVIGSVTANNYIVSVNSGVTWTVYNINGGVGVTGADGAVTYTYELLKDGALVNTYVRSTYTFNYVPTAPGNYEVRAMATDKNGSSAWVTSGTVTVTSSAPVISAVSASASVVQQGSEVTFTAHVTGGYGTKTYYWALYNGGSVVKNGTTAGTTWTVKLDNIGPYMCQCEAVDSVGAKSGAMNSGNVVVETPAPFKIESIKPTKTQVGIDATATWKVNISGGIGTKTVRYTIYKDGQPYSTSSGTTTGSTYTITHWVSETGSYTIEAYVEDANSNVTATVTSDPMLAIDKTSLTITSLTASASKINKSTKIRWTWKIENNQGGVNSYYTLKKTTGSGTVTIYSGYTTGRIFDWTLTAYGVYTLEVYAIDVVTHKQTAPVTGGQVVYGATGPVTVTRPTAVKDTYVASANIQWVWNVSDTVGVVKSYYQVTKDGSPFSVASTTSFNLNLFVDQPGVYGIQVEAVDESGRHSALTYGDTITVTAAPSNVTVSSITPSVDTTVAGNPVTWSYTVKNGVGSVTGYWALRKDGVQVSSGSCAPGTYSFTETVASAGTYTVQVQVVDKNGTSKMVEGGKVVVTPVPGGSLTLTGLAPSTTSTTVGNPVTWSYTVSGAIGTVKVYYLIWRNGSFYNTSSVTGSAVTWPMSEAGSYDIQVEAVDTATGERTGAIRCGSVVTVAEGGGGTPGTFTASVPQPAKTPIKVNSNAVWNLHFSNAKGNVHTYYDVLFNGAVVTHNATYGTTVTYPATQVGTYALRIEAIDEGTGISSGTIYSASVTVTALESMNADDAAETIEAPAAEATEAPAAEPVEEPVVVEPENNYAKQDKAEALKASANAVTGTAAVNETLVWKVSCANSKGNVRYNYEVICNGAAVYRSSTHESTITYTAEAEGRYKLRLEAVDESNGNKSTIVYSGSITVTAAAEAPAAEEPAAEEPAVEEPVAEEPAAEDPAAVESVAEEPAAEEPAAEEPVAEEPAAEEPAAEEPAAEEPAA